MKAVTFMMIAGEASGDMLAAELIQALRQELTDAEAAPTNDFQPLHGSFDPRFFGAGGPRMAAAGVDLAFDLTQHSIIGLSDVFKNYFKFRRLMHRLLDLAIERQPDAIICVDFSGFNRRLAHAIKNYVRLHSGWFHDWNPKIIQYVSPQVWASREGRVYQIARDYDLLLSTFPFEKAWYAKRVPRLRVEFVGNPIVDRYSTIRTRSASTFSHRGESSPNVLLLPGSRSNELNRHLPIMLGALVLMRATLPNLRAQMVLSSASLVEQARALGVPDNVSVKTGDLAEALSAADLAIAATGTVTMECAYFGLPTVAIYKVSWSNFQVAKRIIKVKYAAMPNLLANEEIFPEFLQYAATPGNIAQAALVFLRDESRRNKVRARLREVVASLGGPGASARAARAILALLEFKKSDPRQVLAEGQLQA